MVAALAVAGCARILGLGDDEVRGVPDAGGVATLVADMATVALGEIELGARNQVTVTLRTGTYDDDGVATGLYRMTDPVQNRNMMGIARVRLADEEVDFFTLGPAEPVNQFALAPGGRKAYALYSTVGRYEFWEFDLDTKRVTRRWPFAGRPRMSLRVSADGRKVYVYGAGPTIDVYDAETFELLRVVEFDTDVGMSSVVIPAGG
jgi:hypothetical protein